MINVILKTKLRSFFSNLSDYRVTSYELFQDTISSNCVSSCMIDVYYRGEKNGIVYLCNLFTNPTERKKGHASFLINEIIRNHSDKKAIVLHAAHSGLIPFYENLGFKVKRGEENKDTAILMEYRFRRRKIR